MTGKRPFLEAEWRHLALFNYEVDPALVEPFVPAGTQLDLFEGKAYVSVVGFLFLETRVMGMQVPFHGSFEEVNLRFYVRREVEGEVRRAVTFIQEFVPKPAVSLVARLFYNENYATARMSHGFEGLDDETTSSRSLTYSWSHAGSDSRLELSWDEPLEEMSSGSEEEFIAEHFWGYTRQRDGGTIEYEVEHPRWLVARAREFRFECDVAKVYGERFVETLSGEPSSVFYADGSEVRVYTGERIET
jgi:uncharacterized protein YqjF (DUF2071 family)